MAKSKNHTGHNQNKKNHRNGYKKPRKEKKGKKTMSMVGLNQKFVRNMKYQGSSTLPGIRALQQASYHA